jgi:hypothetical protein
MVRQMNYGPADESLTKVPFQKRRFEPYQERALMIDFTS